MASQDQKLSLLLTGGIDNRQFTEFVSPVVQQGSAPSLVDSRNTRLSVIPGTCVRSPEVALVGNVGGTCYGLVPSECGRTTVAFNRPARGYNRVFANTTGPTNQLKSYLTGTVQSSYLPIDISRAGAVPGAISYMEPCVTHNAGEIWFAYVSEYNGQWVIVASVSDANGAVLAPPRALVVQSMSVHGAPWIGLTAHGNNGVILWVSDPTAGIIQTRRLTVSGNLVGVGSATTVYSPGAGALPVDVVSTGDYGVLVTVGSPGNTQVVRVNAATFATSSVAVAIGTPTYVACSCITLSAVEYVSIAASDSTDTAVTLYRVSDMAQIFSPKSIPYKGVVTLSWLTIAGATSIVCAVSKTETGIVNGFATGGDFHTTFWTCDVAGVSAMSSSSLTKLPWRKLHTHATTWSPATGEVYPVFYTYRIYTTLGDFGYGPGPNDLDDPCITAYVMGSTTQISPVARFGVLRGSLAPARAPNAQLASKGSSTSGDKIISTYLKDGPGKTPVATAGFQSRFVELDFTPRQPAAAHDKDGVTLIAAALPVQWDGQSIVDMGGPIHGPRLNVQPTGGAGSPLPAGVYSYTVLHQWVDAAGLLHRSRPSNISTVTLDGTQSPTIEVTYPDGFRDGSYQPLMDLTVYATDTDGSQYHSLLCEDYTTSGDIVHGFDDVGEADTSKPQIYSLGTAGEELTPQPPPPLRDIAIIGSRAWGIDAEVPSRVVYSKTRIAGVGFEWHPALEINFPAGAGDLLAIRELNGLPIVLTRNAIYQISGEGPDNTGAGGSFGQPTKIADRGCDNRASVVTTPVGIMWQDGEDMVLLAATGLKVFNNIDATNPISGAVLFRNQDEVVFTSASGDDRLVYNYVLDKWSIWDDGTFPVSTSFAANLPWSKEQAVFYSPANTSVYYADGSTVGEAPSMTWETDWILLCGDFQDHVIVRNILFNGQIVSPHSLTIDVFVDYETAPSTTVVWSDAEVSNLAVGSRYTLKLELCKQNCRAVKLRLADTVVESDSGMSGVAPRSVTIVYAQQSLLYEDAILAGAYKG